jgi:uncharacterized membrane protein YciS (DUF1049 family)
MADQAPQSFASHTKFVPPFHFVLMPMLFVNLGWRIYRVVYVLDQAHGRAQPLLDLLVAVALIMIALAARIFALQAQDRVIRLEEKLRWKEVLAPDLAKRFGEVGRRQVIALRFCPDDELAGMAARVLTGELSDPKAIKQAIKNWRPDHHRL